MNKEHRKDRNIRSPKILGLMLITFFIAMLFSGCIGQEQPHILRIGHDREPGFLDPARLTRSSDHAIISNIYSYLIGFEPGTFNMIGDLAKQVPSIENGLITPDGLKITFNLREDVKWHPGIPGTSHAGKDYGFVTAHDVVYTIERLQGLHDLSSTEIAYGMAFESIDTVEAIDDHTVVFHLHKVDVGLLWALAPGNCGGIIKKQAVEDYGADFFRNPIGSGPFKFYSWNANNELVLVKNKDYYGKEPWLDQVIYIPYSDEYVRYTALTWENIDVCSPVTLIELWYVANGNPKVEIAAKPGLKTVGLSFNFEWVASDGSTPLSDVRVRRALAFATNRTEIVDMLLGGVHTEALGFLNTNFVSAISHECGFPSEYLYPYNFTKAKLLLAEAGYPDGLDLVFNGVNLPYLEVIPNLLQAQWARANIRLRLNIEEMSEWINRMVVRADYCVGWVLSTPRSPEPLVLFQNMFHSPGASYHLNYAKYSNPETDALIDDAAVTVESTARYDLYRQIQLNIMRDLPAYPLWWETTFFIHRKKVKNMHVDLFHAHGDWLEEVIIEE